MTEVVFVVFDDNWNNYSRIGLHTLYKMQTHALRTATLTLPIPRPGRKEGLVFASRFAR